MSARELTRIELEYLISSRLVLRRRVLDPEKGIRQLVKEFDEVERRLSAITVVIGAKIWGRWVAAWEPESPFQSLGVATGGGARSIAGFKGVVLLRGCPSPLVTL